MPIAKTECGGRRLHFSSTAVTDEGRGSNDARIATHRTRRSAELWGTVFDPTLGMANRVDADQSRPLGVCLQQPDGRGQWPQMADSDSCQVDHIFGSRATSGHVSSPAVTFRLVEPRSMNPRSVATHSIAAYRGPARSRTLLRQLAHVAQNPAPLAINRARKRPAWRKRRDGNLCSAAPFGDGRLCRAHGWCGHRAGRPRNFTGGGDRVDYLGMKPSDSVFKNATMASSSPWFSPRFPISVVFTLTATSGAGQPAPGMSRVL